MHDQTVVVEPPPFFEALLKMLCEQATGDENGTPEQVREEHNQALVNRGVVSAQLVAEYEALHPPAIGVTDATPHVVRVRYVVRGRTAPTVVRRTPSSGRPARAHSRRTTGTRGSPDDPDLPEPRRCAGCGEEIRDRRRDARTCGPACRKAASRSARAASDAWLADARALALEEKALALVRAGEISGYDALTLVIWPTERVRQALRVTA